MTIEALSGVGSGEAARDHEGPVARLQGQQLAYGRGTGETALGGLDGPQLGGARGERELGDRGPRPGREVAVRAPTTRLSPTVDGRLETAHGRGLGDFADVVQTHELEPLAGALLEDRLQPAETLVPPVPAQLGIDRATRHPAPGLPLAVTAQTRAGASHEVRGVLARAGLRQIVVVLSPVVAPRIVMVGGVAVVVAVGAVGGIAGVAPDE